MSAQSRLLTFNCTVQSDFLMKQMKTSARLLRCANMLPALIVFMGPNNLLGFPSQMLNILIWVDPHEYQQADYCYHMH